MQGGPGHPLAPDLSEVTLEELEQKRSELTTNLSYCYATGRVNMAPQIQMLLMDYEEEIQKRQAEMLEKHQKDNESLASRINIGK